MDADALRQTGAVLLVLALLAGALWAFRRAGWYSPGIVGTAALRAGKQTHGRPLEVVDRVTLAPQHSVHVIGVDGRQFLLAVHPRGCTLLADLGGKDARIAIEKDPAA